jgi:hypothetical protein
MSQFKGKTVLEITAKCSDMFSHRIYKADGTLYREYDGYVPSFMPGEHYGDYVMLNIDPYTGKILDWKPWKRSKKSKAFIKAEKAKTNKKGRGK